MTNVSNRSRSKCISQKVLCQTLAGNEVPLLTITSPSCVADTKNKQGEMCRVQKVHRPNKRFNQHKRFILHPR